MIKEIKIGGLFYDVDYLDELKTKKDQDMYGEVLFGEVKIKINNTFPKMKKQSILHESLHAISEQYDLRLNEVIIEKLTYALYAFLIDNKEYIGDIIASNKLHSKHNKQAPKNNRKSVQKST